jgi:enediyne biosynthesis protein E4
MTGQYDASIGLLLQGDGKGNFTPLSAARSGIHLTGEVQCMGKFQLQNRNTILCAINAGELQVLAYGSPLPNRLRKTGKKGR